MQKSLEIQGWVEEVYQTSRLADGNDYFDHGEVCKFTSAYISVI